MNSHAGKAERIMDFARAMNHEDADATRDASAYVQLQIAAAVMQLSLFAAPADTTHRDVFLRDAGEVFDMVAKAAAKTEQS